MLQKLCLLCCTLSMHQYRPCFYAARLGQALPSHLVRREAARYPSYWQAWAACVTQAMAAYRTAARLFPGLHLPLVGMGMEYARMNNAALAEQLLLAAHRTCPRDALACHELGCLAFRARQLPAAERWLLLAVKRVPGRMSAGEYLSLTVESNSKYLL